MSLLFCDSFDDAIVAYIIKRWPNYSQVKIGRILIQKISYFVKAKGIPLNYSFDMYHYGPYSQELYFKMDELQADGIIVDQCDHHNRSEYIPGEEIDTLLKKYSDPINAVAEEIDQILSMFRQLTPTDMELIATVHYFQNTFSKFYKKHPPKDTVIEKVYSTKQGKFDKKIISAAYDALENAGLYNWTAN
jgi:hypothetical protein